MTAFDPAKIRARIEALRTKDRGHRVFGANGHLYELAAVLTEAEVESVEEQLGVELPTEYRATKGARFVIGSS